MIHPRTFEPPKPKKVSKLQRGGIKPVSAKRVKINRIYSALRKKFLEEHPFCQFYLMEKGVSEVTLLEIAAKAGGFAPYLKSEEIHHKKGRGKYLLDTSTWMAVSMAGHDWIHNHVKESYERGYMLPRN